MTRETISPSSARAHLLMAHYGNFFWTETALEYWSRTNIHAVTLSFQPDLVTRDAMTERVAGWSNRFPNLRLEAIEVSPSQKNHASFDHAVAIDALRTATLGKADYYVIADPDFWVISPSTFNSLLEDLVLRNLDFLVADHNSTNFAHPCLSVFRSETFRKLDIFLGLEGFSHDFGRLWGQSLLAGRPNTMALPVKLFRWGGFWYPQAGGLHFSSQAFVGSSWYKKSLLPWRRYSMNAPRRMATKIFSRFREVSGKAQKLPL